MIKIHRYANSLWEYSIYVLGWMHKFFCWQFWHRLSDSIVQYSVHTRILKSGYTCQRVLESIKHASRILDVLHQLSEDLEINAHVLSQIKMYSFSCAHGLHTITSLVSKLVSTLCKEAKELKVHATNIQ